MSPSSRSRPKGKGPEESGKTLTVAAVIPARLASKRFPRKILARETGKYLVEHVYERVVGCSGIDRVLVATDSEEVLRACRSFGAEVVLTSPDHPSGTDRVAEVAGGLDHDIVINVQGDEPLMEHADLQTLIQLFPIEKEGVVMTTLAVHRDDVAGFLDPNIVKVVIGADGNALYFSRAPVPFGELKVDLPAGQPGGGRPSEVATAAGARGDTAGGTAGPLWYQHVGIYAYRREFLLGLSTLAPTPLEKRERLEQLRVLEHGFRIRVGLSSSRHLGIDTEAEYRAFVAEYLRESQRS